MSITSDNSNAAIAIVRRSIAAVAASLAILAFAACGQDETPATPTSQPTATTAPPAPASPTPDRTASSGGLVEPEHEWSVVTDSQDLKIILATPDLGPGKRRFAVVITDNSGVVTLPVVQMSSYRYPQGAEERTTRQGPVETVRGRFFPFPYGSRGIHVAEISFDQAGTWGIETRVPRPDGSIETAEVIMQVFERTKSVDVGEVPPLVESRTLEDVPDISQLTTGSMHDPDLYRISVPEALNSGMPTVVVFASPAFCTNAVCGPQVEVLSNLSDAYSDKVNFIHVDLFENPHEIQGDLTRGIPSPLLQEWGLVSQEWTFIMDEDGAVVGRFENYAPEPELEAALTSLLEGA